MWEILGSALVTTMEPRTFDIKEATDLGTNPDTVEQFYDEILIVVNSGC